MNKEETKLLIVNTKALWDEGLPDKVKVGVDDNGVSLLTEGSYINAGSFPLRVVPVAFASDGCGVFQLLVNAAGLQQLVVFDKDKGSYQKIDCLALSDATGIAVSDPDIFIAAGDKIICLARVNCQVRWEKPSNEILVGIRADDVAFCAGDIFLLDKGENKIFKWPIKPGLDAVEILKGESGKPISITSGDERLYVLYEKPLRILEFRGGVTEEIPLPVPGAFKPKLIAVHNDILYVSNGIDVVLIRHESRFVGHAAYITKIFDSTERGCQWHKFVLDAEIPGNTRIEVSYCASDDAASLPSKTDDPSWPKSMLNPSDALIIDAKGRYIRFRLELFSDDLGRFSPHINSLKVEFPHHSYLRYLPAVYQEDEAGREFLSRLLPLFETFFSELEEKIFSSVKHMDADAALDEFLPWLGQWLALSRDENWPPEKLRKLIKEAPRLYKMRGTRKGIEEIIKLYIDGDEQAVVIIENFLTKKCREDSKSTYRPEDVLYGTDPYSFCVLLKPFGITPDQLQTVRRMVNSEKPAHTAGNVRKLEPWFYLDGYTYLGINTLLAKPVFVLGEGILSRDTALSDREWSGQADVRARIGEDTKLT